jgi:hypothetical protein
MFGLYWILVYSGFGKAFYFLILDIYLTINGTCLTVSLFTNTVIIMYVYQYLINTVIIRGRRGRDRMVVGFTTIYAISTYHH